ncbi:hypothetical protein CG710_019795 [Lachnotalea glycerini]|nr:hypothetical protein CG710_019795 [Lachnotalea glycerini]
MLELSSMIIKNSNNDFLWYTETRFDYPITDEEGKVLYEGGLRKLQFGLESYNQRILDLMEKRVKLECIRSTLECCMKNKISFHLFYILGFPKETKEEAMTTIKFVKDIIYQARTVYGLQECSTGFSSFGLEKGSKVYKNPDEYSIVIMPDNKNDIGLANEYIAKEGLTEYEAIQMTNDLIENDNKGRGVYIPITRLLGEEFSLFFATKDPEEMYDYKFEYLMTEICLKIKNNPFSNKTGLCYLYYNFTNCNSLILNHGPSELTSFEESLLKVYQFKKWDNEKINKEKMIGLNPFIRYEKQSDSGIIFAYDAITGEDYELNEFTYEAMKIIDRHDYNEAKDILIKNNIFDHKEFTKFIKNVCDTRLVVQYYFV